MSSTDVSRGALREFSKRVTGRWLSRRNLRNNFYILPALAYSVGISVYYLLSGVALDYLPALCFLGAMIAMAYFGSSKKMGRYWISIISIMLSYEALQGLAGSLSSSREVASVYSLDLSLWGFNLTGWVQSTFASPVTTAVTTIFYSMQFPLIVATCVIVWFAKRAIFGRYVTAMVLASYAALVTFFLVPTAPPWYQGVATNLYQTAAGGFLPQGLTSFISLAEVDKFAAFPSMHGAYAIMFSYFMIKIDRRLAVVSIPVTLGILFSTLYLGQHYLLDLLGGAAYALIPCLIAERFQIPIAGYENRSEIKAMNRDSGSADVLA